MNYRREIDGLRALAVLPVIFFHAGFAAFSGGFVGVDIFFVISGYLITSIILSEKAAGVFSLISFWERRARRILPVLFLVMAVSIPAAFVLLDQFALHSFAKSVSAASLFYSNFHFWKDGGYFETAAELKPLLHTWSLAVEEQYYIFFPLFMLTAWKFGRKPMVAMLAAITLTSFGLAVWAAENLPDAAFFLLPMRGWELLLGAFVAFHSSRHGLPNLGRLGSVLAFLGLLLIGFAVATFSASTPFPGVHALVPTLGAVLIIVFTTPASLVGKFLGSRAMVGIGLLSYSAYMWHQPLFAFMRHVFDGFDPFRAGLSTLAAFGLSWLSWKYVELPCRNRQTMPRARFFKFVLIAAGVLICIGLAGAKLFSPKAQTGAEAALARDLSGRPAVYATNMDERQFIKSRILVETLEPDTLVVGSSRIMQVGAHTLGGKPLNLAVSGASLQDHVAITGLAFGKFRPSLLLIGADPWLFNAESGQKRWRSIKAEYHAALHRITEGEQAGARLLEDGALPKVSGFHAFYRDINFSHKIFPAHDLPELRAKIRSDGSRVYDVAYASRTPEQVLRGIDGALDYSMKKYVFDPDLRAILENLLTHYRGKTRVVLVLSPYHPALYRTMEKDRRVFLEIEAIFIGIGKKLGVEVVGSYDPARAGCTESDFYDGSHPRDTCMAKVLSSLKSAD